MPVKATTSRPLGDVQRAQAKTPAAKPAAAAPAKKADVRATDGFGGDTPRVPPTLTGQGYGPVPVELAITESINVKGKGVELPTPAEVAAMKAEGKDPVFSNLALREAWSLGDKAGEFKTRESVQGVVLSIDSYDTRDLDNAMSFRRNADGTMTVGIHAVDLAAWVRLGGALDFAARRRAETKYLDAQGLMLPMLPLSLTEGKLSLFEGEKRLTKSVELTFSPDGQLQDSRIFRSQLTNQFRLDDGDAAKAAQGQGRGASSPELADALESMSELAAKASGNSQPGATMAMDKMLGFYTQLSAKVVGDALSGAGLEASYRNQAQPNQKSSYGSEAEGHASVGAKAYATWTGPMRRYADLDVSRSIDRLIDGKKPDGRKAVIDAHMRDIELDRENKVTKDARLDIVDDLVKATRIETPEE